MGNCIDVGKPVMWADDEGWEESSSSEEEPQSPTRCPGSMRCKGAPVREIEGHEVVMGGSAAAAAATEIKINISRKQLQELLRHAEKGMPLNKLLADLVVIGGQICLHSDDGRHWKPNLQSIPEISE